MLGKITKKGKDCFEKPKFADFRGKQKKEAENFPPLASLSKRNV